jgi:hypothetical protein
MKQLAAIALGFLCLALAGCVEGEVAYTINPDGSARVKIDVITGMPLNPFGAGDVGAKKPEEESLDDMRGRAIRSTLESPGVAAWKDVSAEFLPNGKLQFRGTAYLKKVEDFQVQGGGIPLIGPALRFERANEGPLKLVAMGGGPDGIGSSRRKPKSPEEIKKMTDDELDRQILLDLIDLQSSKPLVTAFLADAKLKTTYVLPGEVTASEGFARDGQTASFTLDGPRVLASFTKALNQDRAAWRKVYREAATPAAIQAAIFDFPIESASITVAKPTGAQFDFDKEVKAARAAYPELRKKFGFGEDLKLPMGDAPPDK